MSELENTVVIDMPSETITVQRKNLEAFINNLKIGEQRAAESEKAGLRQTIEYFEGLLKGGK